MRWCEVGSPQFPRTVTAEYYGKPITFVEVSQRLKPPYRDKAISFLAKEFGVSKQTIGHYIDDFNPAIRAQEERLRIMEADPTTGPAHLWLEKIKYTAAWWPHTNTEILRVVAKEFSNSNFVRVNSKKRGSMLFGELLWRRTRWLAGYR